MGKVFNIQKACLKDGPGIRTTVFLKGCPLRCIWCHNPESQKKENEISYFSQRCINCGKCVQLCPNNCHDITNGVHTFYREKCLNCGLCCLTTCGNLEIFGYEMSADEVIAKVLEDKPFYESGGGMTLSGGEPLFQTDFCLDILRLAKENNIHTCMETCGFAKEELIIKTAEYTDLYLFDYKETNPELHKKYTGVDNTIILSNLKKLDSLGKKVILRCPIIPNYNTRDEHFEGIGKLASSLNNIKKIELEPYHTFGQQKYYNLGTTYDINSYIPSRDEMENLKSQISKHTDILISIN